MADGRRTNSASFRPAESPLHCGPSISQDFVDKAALVPNVKSRVWPKKKTGGLWCHIFVNPVFAEAGFNPALIIGRRGINTRRIHELTGTKVRLRGAGSGHMESGGKEANVCLMLAIAGEGESPKTFVKAVEMALCLMEEVDKCVRKWTKTLSNWSFSCALPRNRVYWIGNLSVLAKEYLEPVLVRHGLHCPCASVKPQKFSWLRIREAQPGQHQRECSKNGSERSADMTHQLGLGYLRTYSSTKLVPGPQSEPTEFNHADALNTSKHGLHTVYEEDVQSISDLPNTNLVDESRFRGSLRAAGGNIFRHPNASPTALLRRSRVHSGMTGVTEVLFDGADLCSVHQGGISIREIANSTRSSWPLCTNDRHADFYSEPYQVTSECVPRRSWKFTSVREWKESFPNNVRFRVSLSL